MRIIITAVIGFLLLNQVIFRCLDERIYGDDYIISKYKIEELPKDINNKSKIVLGDSTLMNAFSPQLVGNEWLNLTTPCATPFDIYVLAKRIFEQKNSPEMVILSSHLMILMGKEICFSDLTLAQNLLTIREVGELAFDKGFRDYYQSPVLIGSGPVPKWVEILMAKLYLHPAQMDILRSAVSGRPLFAENQNRRRQLEENRGQSFCGNLEEFPYDKIPFLPLGRYDLPKFTESYFVKTLALLQDQGKDFYFFHPPYLRRYEKIFSMSLRRAQAEFFRALVKEFPLFHYNDEILFLDEEDFSDQVHVSEKGMKKYSAWLSVRLPHSD